MAFKKKRDEHENIVKYKTRLTPQGCYFIGTYAPVGRMTTVRFVLVLSVLLCMQASALDFQDAFLNATLSEDIYVYAFVARGGTAV